VWVPSTLRQFADAGASDVNRHDSPCVARRGLTRDDMKKNNGGKSGAPQGLRGGGGVRAHSESAPKNLWMST